ncbi:MAG: Rrf2 family transcriptional regulator [Candidatus Margulisbacteria bacterium]|nr:Rrf2 family transcriptional regulator [Candidatus Margulisiibacteriota bacterium]
MKFSTRTRYGLRMMVFLGVNYGKGFTQLKEIANSERISIKYLEHIVRLLKPSGLISVARGAKGGYALVKEPSKINLKELFLILEGHYEPVECVAPEKKCKLKDVCSTYDVWCELSVVINKYLESITLGKLVNHYLKKHNKNMYYI